MACHGTSFIFPDYYISQDVPSFVSKELLHTTLDKVINMRPGIVEYVYKLAHRNNNACLVKYWNWKPVFVLGCRAIWNRGYFSYTHSFCPGFVLRTHLLGKSTQGLEGSSIQHLCPQGCTFLVANDHTLFELHFSTYYAAHFKTICIPHQALSFTFYEMFVQNSIAKYYLTKAFSQCTRLCSFFA